jgi:DNA-binding transcriptional LysR family regulator
MNTNHLKAFAAIVKHGGVIRAAQQLHVTQPALSATLKALETDVGVSLFDRGRGNRPMKLTLEGERLHKRALAILRECDLAREEARTGNEVTERLRIGTLDTLSASWVERFLRNAPLAIRHSNIEIWEGSAQQLAGWLAQARIDAAVSVIAEKSAHSRLLWREPFVAVASPKHPLAGQAGRSIRLSELADQPFVFRAGCEMSPVGEAQLRAAGVQLKTVVRAKRDHLAFEAVRLGHGLTLAPQSLVPKQLSALKVSGLSLSRSIGLVWQPECPKDLAKALFDVARDAGKPD